MSSDTLARVRSALRDAMPELRRRYGVDHLAVFGSVARGDEQDSSDVDLLVRFEGRPPSLFTYVRLEREISRILGRQADLVMESALKPRLRDRILAESVAA